MSLETELCKLVDEYVKQFIKNITENFELTEDELTEIWHKTKQKNIVWNSIVGLESQQQVSICDNLQQTNVSATTAATAATAATAISATSATSEKSTQETEITDQQIMNANMAELKAICKQLKLTVGGKKQDLVDRILKSRQNGSQNTTETKQETTSDKPKKKRSPNRMPNIPVSSIQIKKNDHGNYEHPETKLVFSREEKTVIGKQKDDGTISVLTEEDIELCNQFKFTYRMPEKIQTSADVKNEQTDKKDIIETLDDIIDSEEEDFEEFYESE